MVKWRSTKLFCFSHLLVVPPQWRWAVLWVLFHFLIVMLYFVASHLLKILGSAPVGIHPSLWPPPEVPVAGSVGCRCGVVSWPMFAGFPLFNPTRFLSRQGRVTHSPATPLAGYTSLLCFMTHVATFGQNFIHNKTRRPIESKGKFKCFKKRRGKKTLNWFRSHSASESSSHIFTDVSRKKKN